jgi:hypothetical protein
MAVTGAGVVAVTGSSGIGQVIGPPIRSSSAQRGTRSWRRTRTAASPSAPPVANQRRTSAYAVLRAIRNTQLASSTVSRSGAVPVVGLRIRVVIVSSQPSTDHVLHAYKPQPSRRFRPKKFEKSQHQVSYDREGDLEGRQPVLAVMPHLDIDPPQAEMSPKKFRNLGGARPCPEPIRTA